MHGKMENIGIEPIMGSPDEYEQGSVHIASVNRGLCRQYHGEMEDPCMEKPNQTNTTQLLYLLLRQQNTETVMYNAFYVKFCVKKHDRFACLRLLNCSYFSNRCKQFLGKVYCTF